MTSERLGSPFRFWMTGSVAATSAGTLAAINFGVGETVHRIELAARHRGLTVIARREGEFPVLVLASSAGVTPVVMRGPDSPPDVPYAVHVRAGDDGHAEVYLAEAVTGLPQDVAGDFETLPDLLDGALMSDRSA